MCLPSSKDSLVIKGVTVQASSSLTVKLAVSLGEGGQEELAVVLDGCEKILFALEGQSLLHLTGAAGIILRTETQVLTCAPQKKNIRRRRRKVKTDCLTFKWWDLWLFSGIGIIWLSSSLLVFGSWKMYGERS